MAMVVAISSNAGAQLLVSRNGTVVASLNASGQSGLQLGAGKTVYSSSPQSLPVNSSSSILFKYTGQLSGLNVSPAIAANSTLAISADGNVYNPWGPPYMEGPTVHHTNANNINAVVDREFPAANRATLTFAFGGASRAGLIPAKSPYVSTTNPTTVVIEGGAYAPNSTNAGYDYGWASYWY